MPANEALPETLTVEFAAFEMVAELTTRSELACTVFARSVLLSSESSAAPVMLAENDPSCTLSLFANPRFRLAPVNAALPETVTAAFAAFEIALVLTMRSDEACTVFSINVLLSSDSSAAPVISAENEPS